MEIRDSKAKKANAVMVFFAKKRFNLTLLS